MAILWTFHPFGRRSQKNSTDTVSPFQKLNGFSYHPNWLRNFLIASSLNGKVGGNFKALRDNGDRGNFPNGIVKKINFR
jgi:hypothetical protein